MAYPNYSVATSAQVYPTPTNGLSVPRIVTLSGTGVAQVVNRSGDKGSFIASQLRGPEYVAPMAKSSTLQLTAGVTDDQGNTVTAVNTFTYRSWNSQPLSSASFTPPGSYWLPNSGNGLNWDSDVCTVNSSGLITAHDLGFAIIEVRYPFNSTADSNVYDFIAALLMVTVTTAGTDVEG